jgi:hypothetical protein
MNRPGRRDLLKMLGPGALAFPFLRAFPARAAGLPGPKRFVVVFTSNGTIPSEYLPEGSETNFRFKRILQPLEPHKSKLIVLHGVHMSSFYEGPRAAHGGLLHQLVGRSAIDPPGLGNRTHYTAGGASLDQVIAEKIQGPAPFRSLELGVRCTGPGNYQTPSYKAPFAPNPIVDNPYEIYDRMFRATGSADAARRTRVRGSVVDLVSQEFAGLRGRLGAAERRQLDADLSSLRQIERTFAEPPPGLCAPPRRTPDLNHRLVSDVPAIGKLQMDLLLAALRCDLTRVATFMWYDTNGGNEVLSFLPGVHRTHHDLAHDTYLADNPDGEALVTINRFYSEQFKYLLDGMAATPEGDGTMLDHSVVLFCNSLGNGKLHRVDDVPYILAGSGGGHFRTGRFVQQNGRAHNDLLISLAHAFGLEVDSFGDPQFCTGPIAELR